MNTLATLLASLDAPSFIYLHHPHHPSTSVIPTLPSNCVVAYLDAIKLHTPRLFYSGALNKLEQSEDVEVNTWDGFARHLRQIWWGSKGKRKRTASNLMENGDAEKQLVLIFTKAERLRWVLGGGWAMITRLAELVSISSYDEMMLMWALDWSTGNSRFGILRAVG